MQLTDEEYQQLRSQLLDTYSDLPIQAADKASDLLVTYKHRFSLSQNLRMHYTKAFFLIASEQFESAYSVLSQCKLLSDQLNDPSLTYYYYSYLGGMLVSLESYKLSLEHYMTALEYAEKAKDEGMVTQVYNNLGHVLIKLKEYDSAIFYIERFYQYGLKSASKGYIATALNNLGEISLGKADLQQAKTYFLESLSIRKVLNDERGSSWPHYNLGKVYLANQQYEQAIIHLQKSIDIRVSFQMNLESLKPKITLADVYMQQQEFNRAFPIILSVIATANELQYYQQASEGYDLLRRYYVSQNNFVLALEAADQFAKNEIQVIERKANVALMHYVAKVDLKGKEVENVALRNENEMINQQAQAKQTMWVITLCLSSIIIFTVLYFVRKLTSRNKRLNATINELRKTQHELIEADKMSAMTTLVSGIAHQLNTPLSVVITANSVMQNRLDILEKKFEANSLTLQTFEQYIKEAKSILSLSEKNSEKTAELVQRFKLISAELEGSRVSSFELKFFILQKLRLIASQYQKMLSVEVTGAEVEVLNYPEVLFKVLEQLVKNSTEHKPENINTVLAKIDIDKQDQKVNIVYTDNGKGISENIRMRIFEPFFTTKGMHKSLGLGLNIAYNSVLHLMQGKLSCQPSSSGAKFVIEIPITIEPTSDNQAQ